MAKMRELVLKDLKPGDEGVKDAINYLRQTRQYFTVAKNPQQGVLPDETRLCAPVLDALDEAEEEKKVSILLTEAQWTDLKSRIKCVPMNINNRSILHYIDDVESLKEVTIKKEAEK